MPRMQLRAAPLARSEADQRFVRAFALGCLVVGALAAGSPGVGRAQEASAVHDAWFGFDKALHFSFSAGIAYTGHLFAAPATEELHTAPTPKQGREFRRTGDR